MVPKDVRETQSFNKVWLDVRGRFIQDHQDFDSATGEVIKLVWIKTSAKCWKESKERLM